MARCAALHVVKPVETHYMLEELFCMIGALHARVHELIPGDTIQ